MNLSREEGETLWVVMPSRVWGVTRSPKMRPSAEAETDIWIPILKDKSKVKNSFFFSKKKRRKIPDCV